MEKKEVQRNYLLVMDNIIHNPRSKWGNDIKTVIKKLQEHGHRYEQWFIDILDGTIHNDKEFATKYPVIYKELCTRKDVKDHWYREMRTPLQFKQDVEISTIVEDMIADDLDFLIPNEEASRGNIQNHIAKYDEDYIYILKNGDKIHTELKCRHTPYISEVKFRYNEASFLVKNKSLALVCFPRVNKIGVIDFSDPNIYNNLYNTIVSKGVPGKAVHESWIKYITDYEVGVTDSSIVEDILNKAIEDRNK